jgi:putative ABC transport system substrate-binding protein
MTEGATWSVPESAPSREVSDPLTRSAQARPVPETGPPGLRWRGLETGRVVPRQVDLIMSFGGLATRAAQQATATIPIVFIVSDDPVRSGLVASYARPGGNLTGLVRGSYEDKLLELLKEAVPGIARVACPCRHQGPSPRLDAARRLGLELLDLDAVGLQGFDIQHPEALERVFSAAQRGGADAILGPEGLARHHARLGELAAQSRLPAIASRRRFAASGGCWPTRRSGTRPRRPSSWTKS